MRTSLSLLIAIILCSVHILDAQSGKKLRTMEGVKSFTPANGKVDVETIDGNEISIQELADFATASIYLYNDQSGFSEIGMNGSAHSVPFGMSLWNYSNGPVRIATNSTERIRILNDGNVGIGDSNPDEKLVVSDGNIKVIGGSFIDDGTTLNVPDYVFENDYDLKSIDHVEQYIQKNHHLEGFPSMHNKDGWSSLSMQARDMKMLEKIEELFLYVIDLNHIIRTQKEELELLKERLEKSK